MKKIIYFIIASIFLNVYFYELSYSNLITNHDIESIINGKPIGWDANSINKNCFVAANEFKSSSHSLHLNNQNFVKSNWSSELIKIENVGVCTLGAWVKLESIIVGDKIWKKSFVDIVFLDDNKQIISNEDLVRESESIPWMYFKKSFSIPEGCKYIQIRCFLNECKGKAWFDDFDLEVFSNVIGNTFSSEYKKEKIDLNINFTENKNRYKSVNGLYYENIKKDFSLISDANLSIVRLPPLSNHFYVVGEKNGKLVYDFSKLDASIEKIINQNAVPFINLCWVPPFLESEIFNKDFSRWNGYIKEIVAHYSNKYNINNWYWNFWNEPSVYREQNGTSSWVNWNGDFADFFNFYAETRNAAKSANPSIKFGGSGFASHVWLVKFLESSKKANISLDFLSWHRYGELPGLLANEIKDKKHLLQEHGFTDTELIIDEWSSIPGNIKGQKYTELRTGPYAAAYRMSSIYHMMKSGLHHNIWFNSFENDFGIVLDNEKRSTYSSFIVSSFLDNSKYIVNHIYEDEYITILSFWDDTKVGIISSYFKHYKDLNPNNSIIINLNFNSIAGDNISMKSFNINNKELQNSSLKMDHTRVDSINGTVSHSFEIEQNSVNLVYLENHIKIKRLSSPRNIDIK